MQAAAIAGASLIASQAIAQEKVALKLATLNSTSPWFHYAAGLIDIVTPRLPAGSSIQTVEVAGGVASIKMVQSGKADLAFSFAVSSAEACTGTGAFKDKQDKLRALMGGLDSYYFGTFVTSRSSVTSWDELVAGKNKFWLLTTRSGSTGEQAVRQIFGLLGTSFEDMREKGGFVEATARSTTARQIKDGLADGWAQIVVKGHPTATQVASLNDVTILSLPDPVISGMVEKHGWAEAVMPPNTFKGQELPVRTIKAATNILVAASVSDDVAYAATKAVMESAANLPKVHVALADFNPGRAADPALNGNCPLHPGAAKYYREIGILK